MKLGIQSSMKLDIQPFEWTQAKQHFLDHPEEKKYIPKKDSLFYFIKTTKNQVLALARKKHRDPFILGEGSFSIVVTIQDEVGKVYACKLISPDFVIPDDQSISVMEHLGILKDQMVRPKKKAKKKIIENDEFLASNKGYLILELAPGKPLDDFYDDNIRAVAGLTTLQIDMVALKCCLALLHYHQNRIIHGDLNLKNIHLSIIDDEIIVTLVDQGFSVFLPEGKTSVVLTTERGTPFFAAPEILRQRLYSFESDIYALGTVFLALRRHEWANHCRDGARSNRFTLYEIISLILAKIREENETLCAPFERTYNQAEALVRNHYEQKLQIGISADQLFRGKIFDLVFNATEHALLGLNFCKAFHQTLKANRDARIFSDKNFTVTKVNNRISVTFDIKCQEKNYSIYATETWSTNKYGEKNAVFSLGQLCKSLKLYVGYATDSSISRRPSILQFMNILITNAQRNAPLAYHAAFRKFEEYIDPDKTYLSEEEEEISSAETSLSPSLTHSPDLDVLPCPPEVFDDEDAHRSKHNLPNMPCASDDNLLQHIANLALRPPAPSMLNQYESFPQYAQQPVVAAAVASGKAKMRN